MVQNSQSPMLLLLLLLLLLQCVTSELPAVLSRQTA